jgi:hypothetical protein
MRLFHVTFKKTLPKIKKQGIRPQNFSLWTGAAGRHISEFGQVYAFSNINDAMRWAFKQQWETKKPTVIVEFEDKNPGRWEPDTHWQSCGAEGQWLKTFGMIKPEQLVAVHVVTPEDLKRLAKNPGLSKFPTWHQYYVHDPYRDGSARGFERTKEWDTAAYFLALARGRPEEADTLIRKHIDRYLYDAHYGEELGSPGKREWEEVMKGLGIWSEDELTDGELAGLEILRNAQKLIRLAMKDPSWRDKMPLPEIET